jgi:glycosyltransferase involved in cell wall biosynthesis
VKIAQVAPLAERVPPVTYGGTERIVSFLTEELVKMGHEVTLFASGDSVTSAELVPCCGQSLRTDKRCRDPLAWHMIQLEAVARRCDAFDVIHYHVDYLHFPLSTRMPTPHVTTLHGRLDLPELPFIHRTFPGVPLISISNSQRIFLPDLNWQATVYHGLPENWAGLDESTPEHLTFLGRISPEKRVDRAIEIAIHADMPLVIAAKVDNADQEYFDELIAPMLDHPLVSYIGEVGDDEKKELLRRTTALLFPIDWPEPFGLVMIEAMACGVPVIAFRCGSVPEVIHHGVTGFIVDSMDEAKSAIRRIDEISRDRCRETFKKRFVSSRMAADYVKAYERLMRGQSPEDDRKNLSLTAPCT